MCLQVAKQFTHLFNSVHVLNISLGPSRGIWVLVGWVHWLLGNLEEQWRAGCYTFPDAKAGLEIIEISHIWVGIS